MANWLLLSLQIGQPRGGSRDKQDKAIPDRSIARTKFSGSKKLGL